MSLLKQMRTAWPSLHHNSVLDAAAKQSVADSVTLHVSLTPVSVGHVFLVQQLLLHSVRQNAGMLSGEGTVTQAVVFTTVYVESALQSTAHHQKPPHHHPSAPQSVKQQSRPVFVIQVAMLMKISAVLVFPRPPHHPHNAHLNARML